MWFRIEQNKDGSIATCTAVETSCGSRGAVHYIEADTAESACKILLARYAKHAENERKTRESRLAVGACYSCGSAEVMPGDKRCTECKAKQVRAARGYRARKTQGITSRKHSKTDEDRVGVAMRRLEGHAKAASSALIIRRYAMQRCLEAFDRMTPRNFREWLAEELHKAREKEAASAQRRAARSKAAA